MLRWRLSRAPVAQLDRASAFEAAGRGFESLRAHHSHSRVLRPAGFRPSAPLPARLRLEHRPPVLVADAPNGGQSFSTAHRHQADVAQRECARPHRALSRVPATPRTIERISPISDTLCRRRCRVLRDFPARHWYASRHSRALLTWPRVSGLRCELRLVVFPVTSTVTRSSITTNHRWQLMIPP